MKQTVSEGRELVYDAVLYGLGATLGELGKTELGARFAEKYLDPFLSCPLNAVIRYELAKQGHTLRVHGCTTDVAQDLLESWEAVVPGTRFLTAETSAV